MASAVSSHRSTPVVDLTLSDDDDDIVMTGRRLTNLMRQVSSVHACLRAPVVVAGRLTDPCLFFFHATVWFSLLRQALGLIRSRDVSTK